MAIEHVIKQARSSFVGVDEAKPYIDLKTGKSSGLPRWQCTFLVPEGSDEDKAIQAAMLKVATDKWGDKEGAKIFKSIMTQTNKTCYASHTAKPKHIPEGFMALTAYRYEKDGRPYVLDMGGMGDDIIDRKTGVLLPGKAGKLYSGRNVRGKVEFFASTTGGDGLRAGLQVVQCLKGGDAFGGGAAPTADGFDAVEEGADSEDMT